MQTLQRPPHLQKSQIDLSTFCPTQAEMNDKCKICLIQLSVTNVTEIERMHCFRPSFPRAVKRCETWPNHSQRSYCFATFSNKIENHFAAGKAAPSPTRIVRIRGGWGVRWRSEGCIDTRQNQWFSSLRWMRSQNANVTPWIVILHHRAGIAIHLNRFVLLLSICICHFTYNFEKL